MYLHRKAHLCRSDRRRVYAQAYRVIERSLWALAPAVLLFNLFGMPSFIAAQDQARAQSADKTAAVHRKYCEKWGMPVGSPAHANCMRDLRDLLEETEQSIREDLAANF